MSCAVALQPISKREAPSSALQSKLRMASSSPPLQSKARIMSHAYPVAHPYSSSPAEHRPQTATKSGPRSPSSDEYQDKPFKKLCAMNRECYSSASKAPFHQPNTPSPYLPSSTSEPAPDSPPVQTNQTEIKYLSANCIVVTHYRGDAASVVDEHFSRALAIKTSRENESPLKVLTRSFPASFYQPQMPSRSSIGLAGPMAGYTPSEIYEAYHGGLHSIQSAAGADHWSYPFSTQAYSHRGTGTDVYPTAMASSPHPYQYSSVGFQQHLSRIPAVPVPSQMNKTEMWGGRYYDTFAGATDIPNGIDSSAYSSHYNNVTASLQGFDAPMSQDCPKDLYWL